MTAFRVLIVCVGNVCRSPLGELLLADRLPDSFVVSSAGVWALVDEPMSPEMAVHLEPHGISADGFVSRQLTPGMVEQSDLVLTATKDVRSRVLEDSPGALRRTFTVREFAALMEVVEPANRPEVGPAGMVRLAADERSRSALDDYDIPDPYRRGPEANARAAELMSESITRIAAGLTR